MAVLAVLGLCLLSPLPAYGELPPTAYEQFHSAASEFLVIKVQKVSSRVAAQEDDKVISIVLRAVVTKVHRTRSHLKQGEEVTVTYEVVEHREPWVGPSQVTVPKEGSECPAYLEIAKVGERVYHPAAGGYTFRKIR